MKDFNKFIDDDYDVQILNEDIFPKFLNIYVSIIYTF